MLKKHLIPLILATGCVGAASAANDYYVVVPTKGHAAAAETIGVALESVQLPGALATFPYAFDFKTLLRVTGDKGFSGTGVTWELASGTLPVGLSLSADGVLSGTPRGVTSTRAFSVRATYKTKTGETAYQLVMTRIAVVLQEATLPNAKVGVPYVYDIKPRLSVTGDPSFKVSDVSWSVVSSTLPDGLTLKTDGTISGTPTTASTGYVTARATYRGFSGQLAYQVVTLGLKVELAQASLPVALVGQPYSYDLSKQLAVSGDDAFDGSGVTWSVVSSSLPDGLTLKSDGKISGTPTVSGVGEIVARAAYKTASGQTSYSVVSNILEVSFRPAVAPGATVGTPYSYDLAKLLMVSGPSTVEASDVTWAAISATLPPGLSLDSKGLISGTPSSAARGQITARATYRGVSAEDTYFITAEDVKTYLQLDSTADMNFGAVSMSAAIPTLITRNITNKGPGKILIVRYTLPDGVGVYSSNCATDGLASGATCTIKFHLQPTEARNYTGVVSIYANNADPVSFNITGTGVQ